MKQLPPQHLNVNIRYNKNALAQLDDCIEGLSHLGPNVTTLGPLLHLGHLLHEGRQRRMTRDA